MNFTLPTSSKSIQEYKGKPFGTRITVNSKFDDLEWLDFISGNMEAIKAEQKRSLFVLLQHTHKHTSNIWEHQMHFRDWQDLRCYSHDSHGTFIADPDRHGTFIADPERIFNGGEDLQLHCPGIYVHRWKVGDVLCFGNGVVHDVESVLNRRAVFDGHIHPLYTSTLITCIRYGKNALHLYRLFSGDPEKEAEEFGLNNRGNSNMPGFWEIIQRVQQEQTVALSEIES